VHSPRLSAGGSRGSRELDTLERAAQAHVRGGCAGVCLRRPAEGSSGRTRFV